MKGRIKELFRSLRSVSLTGDCLGVRSGMNSNGGKKTLKGKEEVSSYKNCVNGSKELPCQ